MQVAQAASDDPFVKVRGMINDMITKLEEEARKEASKEAKCKADKEKGTKDLKVKKADFNKLLSRSDAAEAKVAKLGNEIQDLGNQLRELAASVKEATKLRNEEAASNAAVIKDSAESIEALNGAVTVLSDYYGTEAPAFIQVSEKKQGDTAAVIISILQTAQEDFEKLKQETEAAESKAANKYDKDMQAAEVSKAKKTAQMEGKQNEKSSVKEQLTQISDDLADAEKALQAAQDFLKGVMEACANKAMSFEERQQRRAAEIEGLKQALEILSPDAEFLQTSTKFLGKQ
jgi:vacuolar-type H+-ATPase subunit I/STV1